MRDTVVDTDAGWHQKIIVEILSQLHLFLRGHPVGEVVPDIDVLLRPDLFYRSDVVFLRNEKTAQVSDKVTVIPDLVVEIISPSSRSYDSKTKWQDYEAAGVGEYWLIDPAKEAFTFLVLRDGAFQEATAQAGRYASSMVPGFELDIERVRAIF